MKATTKIVKRTLSESYWVSLPFLCCLTLPPRAPTTLLISSAMPSLVTRSGCASKGEAAAAAPVCTDLSSPGTATTGSINIYTASLQNDAVATSAVPPLPPIYADKSTHVESSTTEESKATMAHQSSSGDHPRQHLSSSSDSSPLGAFFPGVMQQTGAEPIAPSATTLPVPASDAHDGSITQMGKASPSNPNLSSHSSSIPTDGSGSSHASTVASSCYPPIESSGFNDSSKAGAVPNATGKSLDLHRGASTLKTSSGTSSNNRSIDAADISICTEVYIERPGPNDIIGGKGRIINEGNKRFEALILDNKDQYRRAKKGEGGKKSVVDSIVSTVRKRGGHFLKKCEDGRVGYVDMGGEKAAKNVGLCSK